MDINLNLQRWKMLLYSWRKTIVLILIVGFLIVYTTDFLLNYKGKPRKVETTESRISSTRLPITAKSTLGKATEFVNVNATSKVIPDTSDWFNYFIKISMEFQSQAEQYKCKNKITRGNWFDCNSEPFIVKKPCLVYSFGIANDFRFDDDMDKLGCEVHSFDPSMQVKGHKRGQNITFHPIGLGSDVNLQFQPRQDIYVTSKQTWEIRTLLSIQNMLGHKKRTIDILKMDTEGYEWNILKNILDDGLDKKIKQFQLEFHIFPGFPEKSQFKDLYRILQRFQSAGFKRFNTFIHLLHTYGSPHIQVDVSYVNTRFIKN